ncbi:hypothetical protein [Mycoplasma miroungirhinis]|uniref:Transmembrane protein n=1 Tax=Mycoplasma miroungirhinis TaxID=754516 RepID=A0A6M4JHG5_9MOLU|nr:hypothetical protein [Mycoplasma miroungirhinis]QJR43891.1 hypothetical protein HLA92_00220 [Mycoplasma miroungirhinis]
MNPFFFGNQKTREELMQEDKSKFRPWFIWFTIALAITFLLAVAGLSVVLAFNKNYYTEFQKIVVRDHADYAAAQINAETQKQMVYLYISAILPFILFGIMLAIFIKNFSKSVQKKDYSVFNPGFFTFSVVLIIFYIITNWNLPYRISTMKNDDYFSIISIFNIIFYVLSYLFIGSKCSKITKTFRMAKLYEKSKSLEEQFAKNPNQSFNDLFAGFANQNNNFNSASQETQPQNEDKTQPLEMNEEEINIFKENPEIITSIYYQKLKNMSREQLNLIANKLNIFGNNDLTDIQLKVKIAQIYLSKENKGKNND